jgi:hypothetical protein
MPATLYTKLMKRWLLLLLLLDGLFIGRYIS